MAGGIDGRTAAAVIVILRDRLAGFGMVEELILRDTHIHAAVAYVAPCTGLASGRLHLRSEDAAHCKRDQAGYDNDERIFTPAETAGSISSSL